MSDITTRIELLDKQIHHNILRLLMQELAPIFTEIPSVTSVIWMQDHDWFDDNCTEFMADTDPQWLIINRQEYDDITDRELLRAADYTSTILEQFPKRMLSFLHEGYEQFTLTREGITIGKLDGEPWEFRNG